MEKMVDLLHDIYLMEGFILANINLQENDSAEYYFAGVLRKHRINYSKFKDAMDCYLFNQEDMDLIHYKVLQRISKRKELVAKLGLNFAETQTRLKPDYYPDCFVADVSN